MARLAFHLVAEGAEWVGDKYKEQLEKNGLRDYAWRGKLLEITLWSKH